MITPLANERSGSPDHETISATLLAKVKAADVAAWERLVNLYQPEVYRWCRQANLQPSDAQDVSQEVFQRILQHVQGFSREHAGQSFGAWLRTITRHQIADWFRRRGRQPLAVGGSDAHLQLQGVADAAGSSSNLTPLPDQFGMADVLKRIKPEFEEHTWEAFRRMVFDGEAAADIARQLGMNKRAVRQAKYRIVQRLRRELRDQHRGDEDS